MAPTWKIFPTPDACATAQAAEVAATLQAAISSQGRACLAVSGGRSPIAFFEALADTPLPWEQVHITLVDDRFVPPTDPDSNARLVRTHLLRGPAALACFTPLVSNPGDLAASVAQANRGGNTATVTILGMGPDGHTASLFPGAAQLAQGLAPDATARYLHVTPPPGTPHERISMTLAAILTSGRIIISIAGADKRTLLEKTMQGRNPTLPISYVINQQGVPLDVYWHP